MANGVPLHLKYRPKELSEVIGQGQAVKQLRKILKRGTSRAFLLSGPSGCGKTTIARIIARMMGCEAADVLEIDAATHTGIDSMRAIQEILRFKPFGKSTVRAILVDEAHSLSRQSWESLLKSIEEPPEHVVWFFCTTNPLKVPQAIKTRCTPINLKAIKDDDLYALLDEVTKAEQMEVDDDVADVIIQYAEGSARLMLVNLALCEDIETGKAAAKLLKGVVEGQPIRDLCQLLMRGGSWMRVGQILQKLEQESPEGIRIAVCNYFAAVIRGAKNDKAAISGLSVLENFSMPYNQAEGAAPLYLSIGRTLFQE